MVRACDRFARAVRAWALQCVRAKVQSVRTGGAVKELSEGLGRKRGGDLTEHTHLAHTTREHTQKVGRMPTGEPKGGKRAASSGHAHHPTNCPAAGTRADRVPWGVPHSRRRCARSARSHPATAPRAAATRLASGRSSSRQTSCAAKRGRERADRNQRGDPDSSGLKRASERARVQGVSARGRERATVQEARAQNDPDERANARRARFVGEEWSERARARTVGKS
eukprot:2617861-Prymnesium_polylepis.1